MKIHLSQLQGTKSGNLPKIGWKNIVIQWVNRWWKFWAKATVESHKTFPIVADIPQEHFVHTNGNGANGHAEIETKLKAIQKTLHWKPFAVGIIAGLLLCMGFLFASHWKHISTGKAINHIGESTTVVGTVSEIHVTAKGSVLIDMDGRFPNEQFTAVWLASGAPVAQLQTFDGKTISVKGTIQEYRGRPEIILTSLSQISD